MTAYSFDDTDTHPRLTKAAVNKSKLDDYLIKNIGFSKGIKNVFKGTDRNGFFQGRPAQEWLWIASTDEDYPTFCRASNHFHNPIHSGDWLQSQMSDSVWVDLACGTTGRYSNVTWANDFEKYVVTNDFAINNTTRSNPFYPAFTSLSKITGNTRNTGRNA
jgi:hypothetical protein